LGVAAQKELHRQPARGLTVGTMPDLCDTPTPSRLRRRKNCGRSAPTVRLLRLSRGELLSGLVRLGFTDAQTFRAGAGMWESLVQPLCVGADDTNAQRLGHAVP